MFPSLRMCRAFSPSRLHLIFPTEIRENERIVWLTFLWGGWGPAWRRRMCGRCWGTRWCRWTPAHPCRWPGSPPASPGFQPKIGSSLHRETQVSLVILPTIPYFRNIFPLWEIQIVQKLLLVFRNFFVFITSLFLKLFTIFTKQTQIKVFFPFKNANIF